MMVNRNRLCTTLAAGTLMLASAAGCQLPGRQTPEEGPPTGREFQVRVIDGAFRTAPAEAVNVVSPIYDANRNEIKLVCARNEASGFHVIAEAGARSYGQISVRAEPLASQTQALDASALRFYRAMMVEAQDLPGWHIKSVDPDQRRDQVLDVLIPAEAPKLGQPYALKRNQRLYLWAEADIPPSADPGTYASDIQIFSRDSVLARLQLEVEVLPLTLPDTAGVSLLGPLDTRLLLGHHLRSGNQPFAPARLLSNTPMFDQAQDLINRTFRLLLRHRISPYLADLRPITKIDEGGELIVDWQEYDMLLEPLLAGALYGGQPALFAWPVPFDGTFPKPPPYDPLSSPTYTRTLRQYLALCREQASQRGWLEAAFVLLPSGERIQADSFRDGQRYGHIARLASRRLPLVCTLPPHNLAPYGWEGYPYQDISTYVDIWCPRAQFFDRRLGQQRGAQRRWVRLDRPPFSGDISLRAEDTFTRVIPWQVKRLGAEALLLPTVNDWTSDFGARDPVDQFQMRATPLLVPGRFCGLDEPLPTLRLKMLRRGMQDMAYLQMCVAKGQRRLADTIVRSLCHHAGADAYGAHFADGRFDAWHQDPAWWNYARGLMQAALSPAGSAEAGQTIGWQRFVEATQSVVLRNGGTRINYRPQASAFAVECRLSITNHGSQAAPVSLSFGDLPPGWSSPSAGAKAWSETIQPYAARHAILHAEAKNLPAGNDGKFTIPVTMTGRAGQSSTWLIPVSHITAQRLNQTIVLDGDLGDWPMGISNVVGHFTPISRNVLREDVARTAAEVDSAGTPIGYVCFDQEYVYFGFHCPTQERYSPTGTQRNYLEYDDRIPVGDEVLEILIDPTNGGSSTPGDLYHIAIKPTGVCFEERGIKAYPQVGHTEPWAGHAQVETKIHADRWSTEVRIPLSAFDAPPASTWGINFCRFDGATKNYSNWSSAQWNAYNPATLGNVSFPN